MQNHLSEMHLNDLDFPDNPTVPEKNTTTDPQIKIEHEGNSSLHFFLCVYLKRLF